ncbi:MAG TPA: hypothetical protein VFI55_06565, partial [Mycobacterium sp.]|nr:hypothetical protein [Mycobacterium sp.]
PGQLAPAVLSAVTGTVLSGLSGHGLVPVRGLSLRGINKGLAVLAVAAALSSVAYAATMIQAARAGHSDDDTWGLMHLPTQAAFALSVARVAVLAVFGRCGQVGMVAGVSLVCGGIRAVVGPAQCRLPRALGQRGKNWWGRCDRLGVRHSRSAP